MDIKSRLKDIAISESGFVFDPFTGQTFNVNPSGRVILEKLREGLDEAAIEAELSKAFDVVPSDDLARDVREFILMLRDGGIISREDVR